MRIAFVLCACMLLSACGTPISSFANMAVSSVSYFFTGKTTTDHGLSLVLQEDCEIIRALEGQICRPIGNGYPEGDFEVALQPLGSSPELAEAEFLRADGSVVVDPDRPMLAETPLSEDSAIEGTDGQDAGTLADRRDPRATQTASNISGYLPAQEVEQGSGWDRGFGFYQDR